MLYALGGRGIGVVVRHEERAHGGEMTGCVLVDAQYILAGARRAEKHVAIAVDAERAVDGPAEASRTELAETAAHRAIEVVQARESNPAITVRNHDPKTVALGVDF